MISTGWPFPKFLIRSSPNKLLIVDLLNLSVPTAITAAVVFQGQALHRIPL
jgi:hypothetical protein